jgi:fructokinase
VIDAVCFGEALVDLLPDRRGALRDASRFEVHSGGAPANVAVGLARLGLSTTFVGTVGADEFGYLLARKLADEGIDVRLRHSPKALTGLWFVALDENGDRSFFAPTGAASADKFISSEDLERIPSDARIFHCGSSSHVLPEAGEVLRAAVRLAKQRGMIVSFDPNVRAHLWKDLRDLRALCQDVLPFCDIVKLSEEELEPCAGVADASVALDQLAALGVKLTCITQGERGVLARRGAQTLQVPAPQVAVVDTTGAGDGFVAGLLASNPLEGDLHEALRMGCLIGSRVCTRPGAVAGLPRRAEI